MKVKEAIEFLDHMANSFKCISSLNCKDIDNKKNDIVFLLEQGEENKKYKQMWEEFKIYNSEVDEYIEAEYMLAQMKNVEQKYFPKEMIL